MRIIAGTYRSRALAAPSGLATRPTSDRLRETLFNVLTPRIEGANFLDLYAGSGAVGMEALSRGAAHVEFVERAEPALRVLRANLARLGLTAGFRIHAAGVAGVLRNMKPIAAFDVVFLDPPYQMRDAYGETLRMLAHSSLIWAMSLVIAEHEKRFDPGEEFGLLRRFRKLAQGSAALSFYRMGSAGDLRV